MPELGPEAWRRTVRGRLTLVLAFFVGPRIRRIAAEHDLRTVGDFLDFRYGRSVRAIVAALLWVGTLAILAGQLVAMGLVFHAVIGLRPEIGSAIGGAVMTIYFTAGGLLTRVPARSISQIGRNTQGVRLVKLNEGDRVIAAARIADGSSEESDEASLPAE